ncbi:MAG: hypothetical protein ACRC2K_11935, partial [Clostridium sp.]
MKQRKNKNKVLIILLTLLLLLMTFINVKWNTSYISLIIIILIVSAIVWLIFKEHIKMLSKREKLIHRKYNVAIKAAYGVVWEWDEKSKELVISSSVKELLKCKCEIDSFEKFMVFVHS